MDLESLLHTCGYVLIFLGVLAEGETLLLLGGYFAQGLPEPGRRHAHGLRSSFSGALLLAAVVITVIRHLGKPRRDKI
jgi:hypothetical protein